jgi:hypothetical protein
MSHGRLTFECMHRRSYVRCSSILQANLSALSGCRCLAVTYTFLQKRFGTSVFQIRFVLLYAIVLLGLVPLSSL